jgi:hypothetical protein
MAEVMRCRWCGEDVDRREWVNGLHKKCDLECRGVAVPAKVEKCEGCGNFAILLEDAKKCIKCQRKERA